MVQIIKKVVHTVFTVIVFPLVLIVKLEKRLSKREGFYSAFVSFLSLFPGKSGSYLRKAFYCQTLRKCSIDCHISFGTLIPHRDTEIGKNVYIGAYSILGVCTVGDDVLIASRVSILSGRYQHGINDTQASISDQLGTYSRVIIGKNSWIGEGAIVMANVGKNCVIGAGSVVVREIKSNSVVVGNPAKIIRER